MAYKRILDHPDDEVIFDGWTWGQHRDMLKTLRELEMTDEQVARSRERLDEKLVEAGLDPNADYDGSNWLCEFCLRPEPIVHAETCPSYDPNDRIRREAQAYQWWDEGFHELHTSSSCCNDEEAIEFFRLVALWYPDSPPMYVLRKEFGEETFHMIPWKYVDGEVLPIGPGK